MSWSEHNGTFIKTNANDAFTEEEAQERLKELQKAAYEAKIFKEAVEANLTEATNSLTAAEAERDELETVLSNSGVTPILYTQWSTT